MQNKSARISEINEELWDADIVLEALKNHKIGQKTFLRIMAEKPEILSGSAYICALESKFIMPSSVPKDVLQDKGLAAYIASEMAYGLETLPKEMLTEELVLEAAKQWYDWRAGEAISALMGIQKFRNAEMLKKVLTVILTKITESNINPEQKWWTNRGLITLETDTLRILLGLPLEIKDLTL